jgi:hypothetical protein
MAPIVNDYFRFKSIEEIEETERRFNEIMGDEEETEFKDFDSSDAEDIFN